MYWQQVASPSLKDHCHQKMFIKKLLPRAQGRDALLQRSSYLITTGCMLLLLKYSIKVLEGFLPVFMGGKR